MITHTQIWAAIDTLAKTHGYSASGLAKQAGLDPTSFNRSKRKAADGKPRWPSTESISKVLNATGATMNEFLEGMVAANTDGAPPQGPERELILLNDMQAVDPAMFDETGFPTHPQPALKRIATGSLTLSPKAWVLEVTGTSFAPYYHAGDILVVDPAAVAQAGDVFLIRRRSEQRLSVYRGQSAKPVVGESLGRIMMALYRAEL